MTRQGARSRISETAADNSLTPMVDAAFLLLVFFIQRISDSSHSGLIGVFDRRAKLGFERVALTGAARNVQ